MAQPVAGFIKACVMPPPPPPPPPWVDRVVAQTEFIATYNTIVCTCPRTYFWYVVRS